MRVLMAAVLAAALPLAAAAAPPGPVARIVLVTIDTLRADHVGAYGGPVPTPAIDALARDGVLLTEACTPTPSTGPAHASLFTGLHPWRHRVLDNAVPLPAELPRLATWMRSAGYSTAAFVSSYIVHERFGFGRGFEVYSFRPTEGYTWRGRQRDRFWTRGEFVVDAAMGWITAHASERFFVWVHLFDPHSPYASSRPAFASPRRRRFPSTRSASLRACATPRQLKALIRAYRGEVRYADAQVGRLVERLRSLGVLDETAIVVSSDHGEGLGDHGLLEHGANLHDELVRVPLVLRAPGLPQGRRLAGSAQLEDLAPTLLSLAGVPVPTRSGRGGPGTVAGRGRSRARLARWSSASESGTRAGPIASSYATGPGSGSGARVEEGESSSSTRIPSSGPGLSASGLPEALRSAIEEREAAPSGQRLLSMRRLAGRWRRSATSTEVGPHSA